MKQRKRNLKVLAYLSRWPIFRKIFTGMVLSLLVSVVLMTAVNVSMARKRLYDSIRADIAVRAALQRDKVALLLAQYVSFARCIAVDADFIAWVMAANATYDTEPTAQLKVLDMEWQEALDSSERVRNILAPELSGFVRQLLTSIFAPSRVEVLVTDRYGALVAATYRPAHYDQSQTDWWETMHATPPSGGAEVLEIYIGTPALQPSLDWEALPIVVPLRLSEPAVGFVHVLFDSKPLHEIMDAWIIKGKIWGALIDANDNMIAGTAVYNMQGADINPAWFDFTSQRQVRHWYEVPFENGELALVGDAGLADVDVGNGYNPLADLEWLVFVYQPVRDAYRSVYQVTNVGWWGGGLLFAVVVGISVLVARIASIPAEQMRQVVEQHAAGDQNITAWMYAEDELGQVALGINRLLADKKVLQATVTQREAAQEQVRARRQRDVAAAAAVGDVVSATLDIAELAQAVVELLHERFNLYFVGLFLMNEARTRVILQAGTGEAGEALLARAYRVPVGAGLIGECVTSRAAQLDSSLAQHAAAKVPELPYAQAEMAVPLRSRGEVSGALWALSYHTDTFDDELVIVLQTIADQIAVAIDSMRLFSESQETNARLQRADREAARSAWTELTRTRDLIGAGYEAQLTGVVRIPAARPEVWRSESRVAWEEAIATGVASTTRGEGATGVAGGITEHHLALPIMSRDEVIGVINVSKPMTFGDWTADELLQLEALTVQVGVALENARLYEGAQDRAMRQRLMSDVSSRIRASLDVENVLQTAVKEMRAVLGLEFAEVRLGADQSPGTGRLDTPDKDGAPYNRVTHDCLPSTARMKDYNEFGKKRIG